MLREQRIACADPLRRKHFERCLIMSNDTETPFSSAMRVLRPQETCARVRLCDRQLREMEAQGLFPKRFSLNPSGKGRAVGHLESEVEEWIATRAAARTAA